MHGFSSRGLSAVLFLGLVAGPALWAEDEKKEEKQADKGKIASVVQIRLRGSFEDSVPEENPFGAGPLHFKGLLDIIRKATADSNVAAIYLRSESPALGLPQGPR